jgi:tmRNA-binding protein
MLITFQDPDGVAQNRSARFSIEVLDQTGANMTTLTGDLVPHLNASQISALQSFLNVLRAQAVSEVLG